MASDFHEVRFPLDVSLGSRGGPVRRTDIVTLSSGREHRNSRWAQSRRRFDAGLGVMCLSASTRMNSISISPPSMRARSRRSP
jgi:uncharacterized protein (TIGR02217 family)